MSGKPTLCLLILFLGCRASNSYYKGDTEFVEKEDDNRRVRRSLGTEGSQLPPQANAGSPFLMSSNMQASYFLGQCVMCPPGDPGPRGTPGPQGMPGRDGRDQIILGPIADHVLQSPPETPVPPAESSTSSATGVIYTRWGETSCPSTSQLVYQGVMGSGNNYNQKGSGVDFLCLPLEPTFADPPSHGTGGANIYGVEYEQTLPTSPNIHQSEAPCAVCLSPGKHSVVTIPGTNTCLGSQEWTLEYQGYMMSSHYTTNKSQFVCIDQNAEGIPRTNHNNNEPLLYNVDAKCSAGGGGLPCPPYVDGYDILCAVCTL
ncbi:uncharacterized protein [Apostichopus japonicus]|uniref:uncharacterized protein n=1 Tax=Stichopus japonicus TaxID=307972 RepID=UPI003AB430AA